VDLHRPKGGSRGGDFSTNESQQALARREDDKLVVSTPEVHQFRAGGQPASHRSSPRENPRLLCAQSLLAPESISTISRRQCAQRRRKGAIIA
jgi:hypothetical protein